MKAHLMFRDADFDVEAPLPAGAEDLTRDLGLDLLVDTMSDGDDFLREVAVRALLAGPADPVTIVHRQRVLADSLRQPEAVREMYALAVEAIGRERHVFGGIFLHSPESVLHWAVQVMEEFVDVLHKLRALADTHATDFASPGFTDFFAMLRTELADDYFAEIDAHLRQLRFRHGVLISAGLRRGLKGGQYVLRRPRAKEGTWFRRLGHGGPPSYTYTVPDRDEAGGRALAELRDRGVDLAAEALATSTRHILDFFQLLRRELGFYIGCVTLAEALAERGGAFSMPDPAPAGTPRLAFRGLYDVVLRLRADGEVVGNDLDADGRTLLVVTGANQGGKSTFLRSMGLAQLMMQAGMFVPADAYAADVRDHLFTHFRREEDAGMTSGRFDEELARMSDVTDALTPSSTVLFNESFAATNEREGSEVSRQIIRALVEAGVRVCCVTHLYDLASSLYGNGRDRDRLFLLAPRGQDGRRGYRLVPGPPSPTSFGPDLYRRIFDRPPTDTAPGKERP